MSLSSPTSAPAITLSSAPGSNITQSGSTRQPGFDSTDLEEPPPYSPRASTTAGETTVEVGPRRPFQTVPSGPSANPPQFPVHNQVTHSRIPSTSSLPLPFSSRRNRSERAASAVQQLSDSLTNLVNNLNSSTSSHSNTSNPFDRRVTSPTGQSNNWTSYPGQNAGPAPALSDPRSRNAHLVPPPRHPLSSSSPQPPPSSSSAHSLPSMADHSSDFAREFYAAGTGNAEALVTENSFAPPKGPPPSERQTSATHSAVPNDARPTSQPEPGHPLLKDGELLVYPKGFECRKCHNVGYKDAKPQKPCKRCWKKYAKPFAGPLVYSFSADTASSQASNFQKPLPHVRSPQIPTASSSRSPNTLVARGSPGACMANHQTGYSPPIAPMPSPPVGSSVTYMAGDPRIGGTLCWNCEGSGSVDILFFLRELCPRCAGTGRIFR